MKVLYSLDSLNRGGAEIQALDVIQNSKAFGIEPIVVATGGGGLEEDFRQSSETFIRLQRKHPVDLSIVKSLRKIIKEHKIQLVQGYQPVEGVHLYLATMGLPVRRVLSFQGYIADRKNRLASKFLIPKMDANIVVSKGLRKWLKDVDKLDTEKSFQLIYNGADPKRLQPKGNSLKKELGLSQDTKLFGMVGNFYRDPRKDQITLCKALPKIFAQIENAHCVFVGRMEDGAENKLAKCQELCRENNILDKVHFLGERDDVPDILAALDVFVFSSLHEGLPLAASEAMLAGVPLVVSNIEPLLEISRNGEFAEVFRIQDCDHLCDKVVKLLKNIDFRENLRNRALQFAQNNFSINAHLNKLTHLYGTLL
jgi:glycosyltransferase involved in cell wall biosynthesis